MSDVQPLIAGVLGDARAPCLTSSFQAECVVLTHLLREQRPDLPVLFLDTFHHFAETLEYRDAMTRKWNLNLVTLTAVQPRRGAFPEVLGRTGGGIIVEADSEQALADGLLALWTDPERAAALGEAGAAGVREHYTVGRMAEAAEAVYRDLAARRH